MKPKKCKNCGKEFTPVRSSLEVVCSYLCAIEYSSKKLWEKEKKEIKKKLQTKSDLLQIAQKVFNEYIRLRDKELPCVSCGTKENIQYHAGHFFSVGSHPNLRFNEFNVHKQCVVCNNYKHGNLIEYARNLPERIGQENYDNLYKNKDVSNKMTTEEIKELIVIYKTKIKNERHK